VTRMCFLSFRMIIVSIHTLQENAPRDLRFDDYELAPTLS
jgi:hypothetical protein